MVRIGSAGWWNLASALGFLLAMLFYVAAAIEWYRIDGGVHSNWSWYNRCTIVGAVSARLSQSIQHKRK